MRQHPKELLRHCAFTSSIYLTVRCDHRLIGNGTIVLYLDPMKICLLSRALLLCVPGLIAAAEEIGGDADGGQSYVISPVCASFLAPNGLSLSASGWL